MSGSEARQIEASPLTMLDDAPRAADTAAA
jgi:hypothetical protein